MIVERQLFLRWARRARPNKGAGLHSTPPSDVDWSYERPERRLCIGGRRQASHNLPGATPPRPRRCLCAPPATRERSGWRPGCSTNLQAHVRYGCVGCAGRGQVDATAALRLRRWERCAWWAGLACAFHEPLMRQCSGLWSGATDCAQHARQGTVQLVGQCTCTWAHAERSRRPGRGGAAPASTSSTATRPWCQHQLDCGACHVRPHPWAAAPGCRSRRGLSAGRRGPAAPRWLPAALHQQ